MQYVSVHSLIERKPKWKDILLPPLDYIRTTKAAKQNPSQLAAILLNSDYFLNFKTNETYVTIRPGGTKDDPDVKDIRALLYDSCRMKSMYKIIFDEPYEDIPVGRKTISIENEIKYEHLYKKPLTITLSKWQDL